jgi:hypothetical protein
MEVMRVVVPRVRVFGVIGYLCFSGLILLE